MKRLIVVLLISAFVDISLSRAVSKVDEKNNNELHEDKNEIDDDVEVNYFAICDFSRFPFPFNRLWMVSDEYRVREISEGSG